MMQMKLASVPSTVVFVSLIACHVYLNLVTTSPTIDEPAHLASAIALYRHGQCDYYAVNPPLTRWFSGAIPCVLNGLDFNVIAEDFRSRYPVYRRREFENGKKFFEASGERAYQAVHFARFGMLPFLLLGSIVCYLWSSKLWGSSAGIAAALLWGFDPLVLGHGCLLTADVAAAAMSVTTAYKFRHWLLHPSFESAILFGGIFGLAIATKFSCLLFMGLFPVLWVISFWGLANSSAGPKDRLPQLGQLMIAYAIAWCVIQIAYSPDCRWQKLGDYKFCSRALSGMSFGNDGEVLVGNRFSATLLNDLVVPFPVPFIEGIDAQKWDFEHEWKCYLSGTWKNGGWWYFYVAGLLAKLPFGTLALIGLSAACATRWRSRHACFEDLLLLAPAFQIVASASMLTNFTVHLRYVIPALPFLFVWASQSFSATRFAAVRIFAGVLFGATVVSSVAAMPYSLAYYNEAAGGVRYGHRFFLDSNTDWGQDLYRLKTWLDKHRGDKALYLAVFSMHSPAGLGLDYQIPPQRPKRLIPPGIYAVSTNLLYGHHLNIANADGEIRAINAGDFDYLLDKSRVTWVGPSIQLFEVQNSAHGRDDTH